MNLALRDQDRTPPPSISLLPWVRLPLAVTSLDRRQTHRWARPRGDKTQIESPGHGGGAPRDMRQSPLALRSRGSMHYCSGQQVIGSDGAGSGESASPWLSVSFWHGKIGAGLGPLTQWAGGP